MAYFPTIPDETAFTAGASPVTPIAGVFDDSLGAVTSGESGSLRITEKRAAHVNLRSESGTEIGTSAAPVRVDPTGTTKQPVTLFDSAGTPITLSSGRILVDGSGVTQPISAASLPLPTGASTSAKQPAIGTAGTPSADVLSVQGIASMTALKVDGSATTQPISGTVADSTLAAIISGGKAAVADAAAEASLATLAGAVSSARVNSLSFARYSGDAFQPPAIANRCAYQNIGAGVGTTTFTIISPAAYFFITAILINIHPAMTCSIAGGSPINFYEGSTSGQQIWGTEIFLPTTSGSFTVPTTINIQVPLFYNSQTSGNKLVAQWTPAGFGTTAAGNIQMWIYYGLTASTW